MPCSVPIVAVSCRVLHPSPLSLSPPPHGTGDTLCIPGVPALGTWGQPGLGDRMAPATPAGPRKLGRCHTRGLERHEHRDTVAIAHGEKGFGTRDSAELCRVVGTNLVTAIATFPEPPPPAPGSGDGPAGAAGANLGKFWGFFHPWRDGKGPLSDLNPAKFSGKEKPRNCAVLKERV